MIHPNEPTLEKLMEIKAALTNTDEDKKKLKAINLQIKRHQADLKDTDTSK